MACRGSVTVTVTLSLCAAASVVAVGAVVAVVAVVAEADQERRGRILGCIPPPLQIAPRQLLTPRPQADILYRHH